MIDDPPLVLIEWVDSGQPAPGWQSLAGLDRRCAHRRVSVGFLVQDDETTKIVAPNLGSSKGDADWDQASGLMTIPAAAVTKIKHLTTFSISQLKTAPRPQSQPLADAQWLRRLA